LEARVALRLANRSWEEPRRMFRLGGGMGSGDAIVLVGMVTVGVFGYSAGPRSDNLRRGWRTVEASCGTYIGVGGFKGGMAARCYGEVNVRM
jgi:hypothetical protein